MGKRNPYVIVVVTFVVVTSFHYRRGTVLINRVTGFNFQVPKVTKDLVVYARSFRFFAKRRNLRRAREIAKEGAILVEGALRVDDVIRRGETFSYFPVPRGRVNVPSSFNEDVNGISRPTIPRVETNGVFARVLGSELVRCKSFAAYPIEGRLRVVMRLSDDVSPVEETFLTASISVHVVSRVVRKDRHPMGHFYRFVPVVLGRRRALRRVRIAPQVPIVRRSTELRIRHRPPRVVFVRVNVRSTSLWFVPRPF